MNKEVKPNTTAELDELLSMAEDYETKKTQVSDRIKGLRSQIYLLLLTVISISLMTYDLSSRGAPAREAFTRSQFLLALIFACVVWWISWLRPIWKKVRYDYRYYSMALDDLLRIITEIMPFVSADEGWSVLKRTEYRIRLYRFHIPEDTGTQRLAPSIIERMKQQQTDSLAEAAKKMSEYPK